MIAADHLGLAYQIAQRFCWLRNVRQQADRDDATQEACLALVRAAHKFDAANPAENWPGYAGSAIRRALRLWWQRRPLVHAADRAQDCQSPRVLSLDSPRALRLRMVETRDPAEGLFVQELRLALTRLPQRERDLLTARFGLDGMAEQTLQEIGDDEGVTREAIRKREEKALKRLRNYAKHNH